MIESHDTISFKCLNLVDAKLPKVDLIFSRDFLVHLKYQDIMEILKKFKLSESTYLLTTTFTNRRENVDLDNLFWRPLLAFHITYLEFIFLKHNVNIPMLLI